MSTACAKETERYQPRPTLPQPHPTPIPDVEIQVDGWVADMTEEVKMFKIPGAARGGDGINKNDVSFYKRKNASE